MPARARSAAGPLKRARRRVLRRETLGIFEAPADVVATWADPEVPGVTLRPAGRDDVPRMAGLVRRHAAARRLAAGDLAIVAEQDGLVVGCAWLTRRPMWAPHFRIRVRPAPGEGYVHGLAVRASHRRRGIGVALFRAVRLESRRRGVVRVTSHVQLANRPALAVQRAGGGVIRVRLYAIVLAGVIGIVLSARPVPEAAARLRRRPPPAAARLRAIRRLVRRVRNDLVHVPTGLAAGWQGAAPAGVEVRRATAADVRAMRATFPPCMARTLDHLLARPLGTDGIREGQVGIVAVRDGSPIGCAWASCVPIGLPHLAIRAAPTPGEWYAYGVYILAGSTGGIATGRAVMGALLRAAGDAGAEVVSGHVEVGNRFNPVIRRLGGLVVERSYAVVIGDRRSLAPWRRPLAG